MPVQPSSAQRTGRMACAAGSARALCQRQRRRRSGSGWRWAWAASRRKEKVVSLSNREAASGIRRSHGATSEVRSPSSAGVGVLATTVVPRAPLVARFRASVVVQPTTLRERRPQKQPVCCSSECTSVPVSLMLVPSARAPFSELPSCPVLICHLLSCRKFRRSRPCSCVASMRRERMPRQFVLGDAGCEAQY